MTDEKTKPKSLSSLFKNSKDTSLFSNIQYKKVKEFLQNKYSLKLDGYRDEYLLRRVSYHFRKSQIKEFDQYLKKLSNDEKLTSDLIDVITVNVSYFFRDTESFDLLKREIIPELQDKFLYPRVWSVGCSIGAEIYSIALILHIMGVLNKYELTASDNDLGAIMKAKQGIFSSKELKYLPKEYKKYFQEIEHKHYLPTFVIDSLFRDSVNYHKHDVTSLQTIRTKGIARPYHLIACRNVMIYFSQEIKEQIYECFYDWLEPGGILFIGANELLVGPSKTKFEVINNQFYRKPRAY